MANEKRLIDAEKLTDTIENTDWYHVGTNGKLWHGANSEIHTPLFKAEDIFKALNEAPTVDAVEVVRCKDCKHRVEYSKMCAHPRAIGWDALEPEDYDFCSYGERRAEDG